MQNPGSHGAFEFQAFGLWPLAFGLWLFTNGIDYRKWHDNLGTALYFSVITMRSIGYSAITLALAATPTLTYIQGITGVFGIAAVGANPVGA